MNSKVECDQVLYGWAGNSVRKGYQTVAFSAGVLLEDLKMIELHPLPVSFSPGAFEDCLRKYPLPSGAMAYSYIRNAGLDQFGRGGSYYLHVIIVPRNEKGSYSVNVQDLVGNFLRDPAEATYILRNFQSTPIQLPKITVPARMTKNRVEPTKYFSTADDFAWFLTSLTMPGYPVVMQLPQNVTPKDAFIEISNILEYLPLELISTPITSYSNSINDESALFKIFLVENESGSIEALAGEKIILFELGSLSSNMGIKLPEEYSFISKAILENDTRSLIAYHEYLSELPVSLDLAARFKFAYNEYTFSANPDIEGAVYLINNSVTREKREFFENKLYGMIKSESDFSKVASFFLLRLENSDSSEISSVLKKGLDILKSAGMGRGMKNFLENAYGIYSKLGDAFPFTTVFNELSLERGSLEEGASLFILSNRNAYKKYTNDFLSDRPSYKGFIQVESVIRNSKDKKEIDNFVSDSYFKAVRDLGQELSFQYLEDYLNSSFLEPKIASEILKDLLKKSKKEKGNKEWSSMLLDKLLEKGLSAGESDKLRKYLKDN